ncbi:ABC transporter permease [Candidatus Woesearchaeota archaeon]|nr:ABC transporter permease [Candidatus Woesearchaeota archaeon]
MKQLGYELYKNFKIIFRSWSSISLLILGPLVLILLVGFAFSGESIHGIVIGVHSSNPASIRPMMDNFTQIGEIKEYTAIEQCIADLQIELTHICLDFSDNFVEGEELPSGQVVFYYDNTRKKISNEIVNVLSSYFGNTSEQISIESAKTIFKNIEALVIFLSNRNQDIISVVNESENIKSDLIMRKQRLEEFQQEFLPRYYKVKRIQTQVAELTDKVNNSYTLLMNQSEALKQELLLLTDMIGLLQPTTDHYIYKINDTLSVYKKSSSIVLDQNPLYNLTGLTNLSMVNRLEISGIINSSLKTIDLTSLSDEEYLDLLLLLTNKQSRTVITLIDEFTNTTGQTFYQLITLKTEFDSMIVQLDEIKLMLDEEIEATDEYIAKIDASVARIQELREELDRNLLLLSKLNPTLAEKLVKPILQSFEPLMRNIKNIKLAFPSLLAQIIIFISILFANIVTLSELNSKAFLRNLIAPVNDLVYTLGLLITNLIVVLFQTGVLLAVAQFKFNIEITQIILPIIFVCILISLVFIIIGMVFAFVFSNEQTSILLTTFAALTFFLFSDIIAPLETMPLVAANIAYYNPFVLVQKIFRKIIIFDIPLGYSISELTILLGYLTLCTALLILISKLTNKKRI